MKDGLKKEGRVKVYVVMAEANEKRKAESK